MSDFTKPLQFKDALDYARRKHVLPTTLTSAELRDLDAGLKRRARFSSQVTLSNFLDQTFDDIEKIAGGPDEADFAQRAAGKKPLLVSIPDAKARMLKRLQQIGYMPDPDDAGTIKDLRTDGRLQLIVETNLLDTQGFGRWKTSQNEVTLAQFPASELVRMRYSKVPRDWEERWDAARAETTEEGSTTASSGRLVALKNHPIWQALGDGAGGYTDTLGNPWSPFAFNSGMNTIDVHRDDAVQLGICTQTTRIDPDDETGMNDHLEASAASFNAALQKVLADDPSLEMRDGVLTLRHAANEADSRGVALMRARLGGVLRFFANANPYHDERGRFSSAEGTGGGGAEKKILQSIEHGRKSMRECIDGKKDVPDAMEKPGIGKIHFIWGNEGSGVKHIIAKREREGIQRSTLIGQKGEDVAMMMPEVIARGKPGPLHVGNERRVIEWGKYKAVISLRRHGQKEAWLLSGFEKV